MNLQQLLPLCRIACVGSCPRLHRCHSWVAQSLAKLCHLGDAVRSVVTRADCTNLQRQTRRQQRRWQQEQQPQDDQKASLVNNDSNTNINTNPWKQSWTQRRSSSPPQKLENFKDQTQRRKGAHDFLTSKLMHERHVGGLGS